MNPSNEDKRALFGVLALLGILWLGMAFASLLTWSWAGLFGLSFIYVILGGTIGVINWIYEVAKRRWP